MKNADNERFTKVQLEAMPQTTLQVLFNKLSAKTRTCSSLDIAYLQRVSAALISSSANSNGEKRDKT